MVEDLHEKFERLKKEQKKIIEANSRKFLNSSCTKGKTHTKLDLIQKLIDEYAEEWALVEVLKERLRKHEKINCIICGKRAKGR